MTDNFHQRCVTDKELFDLLVSAKQVLTQSVLLEFARKRGIIYSSRTHRDRIASDLSLITHDHSDILEIVERRESLKRGEKTTSIVFDDKLTLSDVRDAIRSYQALMIGAEKVSLNPRHSSSLSMSVEYSEFDYSRTRLLQRQKRESTIEFIVDENKTTIRLPANEKSKEIIKYISKKLEEKSGRKIVVDEIDIGFLRASEERNLFFTSLISQMPGYILDDVISVKVASAIEDDDDQSKEIGDQDRELSTKEIDAFIKNITMQGTNIVASTEYQQLRKSGFHITSMIWRARQQASPQDMVQFEAAFEDPVLGKGFKYGVRFARLLNSGNYAKNFRPVEESRKPSLFDLIETTATNILNDMKRRQISARRAVVEEKTDDTV